ncbi:MAG TPA: ATP-binding protein [Nitrospirales bacterium]|nr:ATP-binding protein [Nitrospira sp. MA-1]HNP60396.1 ATP-binding protein [Nitrospirales bacterium]
MSQLNPKPMIALSSKKNGDTSWPTLDPITEPTISSETLSLALEAKYAETQRLHHHLHRLVKSLPLPALLYNRKGRIVTANHKAQILMGEIDWKKMNWHIQDLWTSLVWPTVPFTDWKWKAGRVSCWDCPLGGGDQPSSLTVRYLRYEEEVLSEGTEQLQRLAAIGEQVGRLAHDIRNPLASIEWFATLLGRDRQSGLERGDLAGQLLQAIRSLDGLVSNLLTASTPLKRERQSVNLSRLLDDVELLAMYSFRRKRLTIHREKEVSHLEILGHEQLLKQALLNLLLNAIQASPQDGHIEIRCRLMSLPVTGEPVSPGINGVALSIRDEGCGMSKEELSRVFQPFYSKRQGGTGLGLPIVKDIVQVHQGRIEIESQTDKGTTVKLFLPQ